MKVLSLASYVVTSAWPCPVIRAAAAGTGLLLPECTEAGADGALTLMVPLPSRGSATANCSPADPMQQELGVTYEEMEPLLGSVFTTSILMMQGDFYTNQHVES